MPTLGTLVIQMQADVARLQEDMKKATGVVDRSSKSMQSSASAATDAFKSLAAGFVAAFSVREIVGGLKAVIDYGDGLRDMARATGASVEQLSFLDYAAKQSGTTLDAVSTAIARLQRNLSDVAKGGGTNAAAALERLGLSAQALAQVDLVSQLTQIGQALNGIKNPAERAALGQQLLGKGFKDIASLILEGDRGVAGLRDRFIELNAAMTGVQADQFGALNDALGDMNTAASAAGKALATALSPALTDLFTSISNTLPNIGPFFTDVFFGMKEVLLDASRTIQRSKLDFLEFFNLFGIADDSVAQTAQRIGEITGELKLFRAARDQAIVDRAAEREALRKAISQGIVPTEEIDPAGGAAEQKAQREAEQRARREADAIRQLGARLAAEREVTEAARIRFELEEGAYKDFSAATKERLDALARELDLQKDNAAVHEYLVELERDRREEAEKARVAARSELEQLRRAVATPREQAIEELRKYAEVFGADSEEYGRKAVEVFNELNVEAEKTKSIVGDLGLTFQSAFEDAALEGAKLSDVINSLAKDMARLLLRRTVTEPLFGSNGEAGLLDSLFQSAGSFFSGLFGNDRGGLYRVAGSSGGERPVAFTARAGEIVAVGTGAQATGGAPIINLIGAPEPKNTSSRVVNGRWVTDMIFTEAAGSAAGQGLLRPLGISPPMVTR